MSTVRDIRRSGNRLVKAGIGLNEGLDAVIAALGGQRDYGDQHSVRSERDRLVCRYRDVSPIVAEGLIGTNDAPEAHDSLEQTHIVTVQAKGEIADPSRPIAQLPPETPAPADHEERKRFGIRVLQWMIATRLPITRADLDHHTEHLFKRPAAKLVDFLRSYLRNLAHRLLQAELRENRVTSEQISDKVHEIIGRLPIGEPIDPKVLSVGLEELKALPAPASDTKSSSDEAYGPQEEK